MRARRAAWCAGARGGWGCGGEVFYVTAAAVRVTLGRAYLNCNNAYACLLSDTHYRVMRFSC